MKSRDMAYPFIKFSRISGVPEDYVVVRSTKESVYYKYVNVQGIRCPAKLTLDLLYADVVPKTVQYLAGHEK